MGATALGTVCQFLGGSPAIAAPTAASVSNDSVIVVLHDQLSATPANRTHVSARRSQASSSQDAVISRLTKRGGAKVSKVQHYTAANAFSLTVTPEQAAALAADPSVAAVIPNTRISVPVTAAAAKTVSPKSVTSLGPVADPTICPTDPSKPPLEPEALQDTNTSSDDPSAKTAQQLTDGSGVKVAYIADAINPDNPDFIRADGSHVITDHKAFSADGPTPEDGGAEAYGDASSIAAQGLISHDLSTFVNPAYPLP
ncbi:MAG: protease inhibitor I9 family protein, partial [Jatrophihabitans sp.]